MITLLEFIKLLEITEWDCKQDNHVYYVDDTKEKLIAFQPLGGELVTYSKPLRFNTRGRKFKVIK